MTLFPLAVTDGQRKHIPVLSDLNQGEQTYSFHRASKLFLTGRVWPSAPICSLHVINGRQGNSTNHFIEHKRNVILLTSGKDWVLKIKLLNVKTRRNFKIDVSQVLFYTGENWGPKLVKKRLKVCCLFAKDKNEKPVCLITRDFHGSFKVISLNCVFEHCCLWFWG